MTNYEDGNSDIANYRVNFRSFYETNLRRVFDEIEKKRQFFMMILISFGVLLTAINIAVMMSAFSSFIPESVDYFSRVFFASLFIFALVYTLVSYLYKRENKEKIMTEFIKFFEGFKYVYGKGFDDKTLQEFKIISKYHDRTKDDYFEGSYKGVNIAISEESHSKDMLGKPIPWFDGIIIALSMNKEFQGQTVIYENSVLAKTSHLASDKLGKVELEDPYFENEFDVFSTDQVEARYLLTTAFMERLYTLRNSYKGQGIRAEFLNSSLLITIASKPSEDLFETSSILKSTTDMHYINQTLDQFLSVLSIIDTLKLNLNIGM